MARTQTSTTHRKTKSAKRSRTPLALAILKKDHDEVEKLFKRAEKARSADKAKIVATICQELTIHAQIEEEIFYPALREADVESDLHHEAEIEHEAARKLMAEIEGSEPTDDYYDSRVKVLSEMIKHHINEEEKRDGMFAEAKKSDMDLDDLGQRLKAREQELQSGGSARAGDGARPESGRESTASA